MEATNDSITPTIDFAKSIALIGVISIHVSGTLLYQYGTISIDKWWIGNLFDSIFRFSVPLFVMINGVLSLTKNYNWKYFYKARLKRLLPPLIFWSVIYIIFQILVSLKNKPNQTLEELSNQVLISLTNGISPHFWFVWLILALAVVTPFIKVFVDKLNGRKMGYLLVVWLVYLFLMQFFPEVIPYNPITYFIAFVGYFIFGFCLWRSDRLKSKWFVYSGILLLFTGLITTIFATYFSSVNDAKFNEIFYEYISLNVLASATGICLLVRNARWDALPFKAWTRVLSKHSYGIYFVHILVLWFLGKYGMNSNFIHPLLGIPITIITCLIISYVLIMALHKIPVIKNASG